MVVQLGPDRVCDSDVTEADGDEHENVGTDKNRHERVDPDTAGKLSVGTLVTPFVRDDDESRRVQDDGGCGDTNATSQSSHWSQELIVWPVKKEK